MSAYLLSIIGIVLLAAVLSAVLPGGKTGKFIKGMTKLACLAVILSPVLNFFRGGTDGGNINFPFFSTETVIETDASFIDYCSTKRIENAAEELAGKLAETFSVKVEVTLQWEYRKTMTEGDTETGGENTEEDGYLSLYEGREIRITKAVLKDIDGSINAETRKKMEEHIKKQYGCEAEFVG